MSTVTYIHTAAETHASLNIWINVKCIADEMN